MKKLTLIIALLSVTAFVFAGGGQEESGGFSGQYSMGGSTTVEPIAVSAIEAYQDVQPDVEVSYEAQGSSVGVQGVIDGIYALGGVSRNLKQEEEEAGVMATPIALDGIAIVVNADVPVDALSLDQVAAIFAGEITNWSEIGGEDAPIVVVNRDEASGTRGAFGELVLEEVIGDDAEFIGNAITTESNGDLVTKVGTTPNTIGYCGFGYIDQARNMGAKTVLVDGAEPTVNNVLNGEFPVSRRLNIVHDGELEEGTFAYDFVQFLLGPTGQDIVAEEDFIALP
ncbi:MAG: phosphate ABC transporter substrate-binding protein [Spirochaetia bacterium]